MWLLLHFLTFIILLHVSSGFHSPPIQFQVKDTLLLLFDNSIAITIFSFAAAKFVHVRLWWMLSIFRSEASGFPVVIIFYLTNTWFHYILHLYLAFCGSNTKILLPLSFTLKYCNAFCDVCFSLGVIRNRTVNF